MNSRIYIVLLFLLPHVLPAQERPTLSGYVSEMPSLIYQKAGGDESWLWENLLHNRLNAGWQVDKYWRIDIGMRNRYMTGSLVSEPGYAANVGFDRGWVDFSWNWIDTRDAVFNTTLDRLFVTFEKDKWNLRLGRQRINWGQTLVWNPNDIFNTYSYFDFDYVERPGTDAFRGTFYHNATSSTEFASSIDYRHRATVALLHHWNRANFDYQVMGGLYTESDMVVGGALSGDINGTNLRAEFSYFQPIKNFSDTTGTAAISFGADHIFPNSLMLQAEVLYNNVGNTFRSNGLLALYSAPLSAKYLSICDWNLFAQATYPVTPRINGAFSTMYFVEVNACYIGLTLDYSLVENLDLSLISQFFTNTGHSSLGTMQAILAFARLKYAF